MQNLTLVMHFNAFNGVLEGGYMMVHGTRKRIGDYMSAGEIIKHLAQHPKMRCAPLYT
jgi:hypothetical protein